MSVICANTVANAETSGTPDYTQDITTTKLGGLTPKAAIVIVNGRYGTGDGFSANFSQSLGFTDGTRMAAMSLTCNDAVATTQTRGDYSPTRVIKIRSGTGTVIAEASCAFISEGIRLTWHVNPTQAFRITCTFFAGTDVSAYAEELDPADASGGTVSTTSPGFKPDLVFGMTNRDEWSSETFHFGVARRVDDSTTYEGSHYLRASNGSSAGRNQGGADDTSFCGLGDDGAVKSRYRVSAWGASGYTVTTAGSTISASRIFTLAIKIDGKATYLNWESLPATTGETVFSGPGFHPQLLMCFYQRWSSVPSYENGSARPGAVHIFCADETDEVTNVATNEQAADPTVCKSGHHGNFRLHGDDTTLLASANTEIKNNGWCWDFSSTDSGMQVLALAIEGDETAAVPDLMQFMGAMQ